MMRISCTSKRFKSAVAMVSAMLFLLVAPVTAFPEETAPQVVGDPTAGDITLSSAVVRFTTDRPGSTIVEYGTSQALGRAVTDGALVTEHAVQLTGLSANTTYHYRVSSVDAGGNGPDTAPDDANPSAIFSFKTRNFEIVDFSAGGSKTTTYNLTLTAKVVGTPIQYRLWEDGKTPGPLLAMPTGTDGTYTFSFLLDDDPILDPRRTVILQVKSAEGFESFAGVNVKVVAPRVTKLKVDGGKKQDSSTILLLARADAGGAEYRVWEEGTAEPTTWTALPAPNADGWYPIGFTLNEELNKSRVYVRVRGETGEGPGNSTQVVLPSPNVKKLIVDGGSKQTTLSLTLLALIYGDISGPPTHYRVWEDYTPGGEPTTWTPLPPMNPDGYYPIPFDLSSLNTKVNVYLKAKGDLAASSAKKTKVRLMEPKIKRLEPGEMPVGSTQPVVVTGQYFGPGGGLSGITFGGVAATVVSWADEEIQCTLPLTVPTGNKVDVVVTSQEGLVGKAKSYTVWPFWAGTWVGRADQTAFSPNPVGPLGYEWRIYWIEPGKDDTAVVQLTDGKRLITVDPVTVTIGSGDFTATGFQKDGTETAVTFTFPAVNQMEIDYLSTGATGWTETGEENAVFMRPSAEVYYDRYYTGESTDQWSSVAGAAPFFDADNVHLFQFKHKKGKLQINERSSGKAKFKGYAEGDVFAVHAKDSFLSGKVAATNAEDTVTEADAVYRWENDVDLGWGEMDVRLSTGAAGVPDGISTWTLTLTENDASDTRTPAAVITVNASKNKITVEVSGTDYNGLLFTSSANGEIYDWPSGGGNFAVSTKNFSIWGRMEQNGTDQITGTFQQTDLWWAGDKEGTVTGTPSP